MQNLKNKNRLDWFEVVTIANNEKSEILDLKSFILYLVFLKKDKQGINNKIYFFQRMINLNMIW